MKVLCDVHIPFKLVSFFERNDVEALHVNGLTRSFYSSDKEIAAFADQHQLVLISKDVDFRNSFFIQKTPKRLIRVCLGNITTNELIQIFDNNLSLLKKAYALNDRFYIEINRDSPLILNT